MDAPAGNSGLGGINPANETLYAAWWRNSLGTTTQDILSFTITDVSAIPVGESLRLGLLFDTRNQAGNQTFTITQTTGGSATATSPTLSFSNDGMDAAFFDFGSLADNDVFLISATPTDGSTYPQLAGVTFDTGVVIVPEPSTTALLGLGGLALILRRRR